MTFVLYDCQKSWCWWWCMQWQRTVAVRWYWSWHCTVLYHAGNLTWNLSLTITVCTIRLAVVLHRAQDLPSHNWLVLMVSWFWLVITVILSQLLFSWLTFPWSSQVRQVPRRSLAKPELIDVLLLLSCPTETVGEIWFLVTCVSLFIISFKQRRLHGNSGGSRLPELGGPEILKGGRGLGDGSSPAGSWGGAPVGGVGDEVPQKPKHFA